MLLKGCAYWTKYVPALEIHIINNFSLLLFSSLPKGPSINYVVSGGWKGGSLKDDLLHRPFKEGVENRQFETT